MKRKKVFRIAKYVFLVDIIMMSLMLTACNFIEVEVQDDDPKLYILEYKGREYYGSENSIWLINNNRRIGHTSDLEQVVYSSIGEDKNKFIEIWFPSKYKENGYGLFVREDIKLEPPYSGNIGQMSFQGNESEEIRSGIISALDAFYNNESVAISSEEAHEKFAFINSGQFVIKHKEYDLFCKAYYYFFNNNYYIYIFNVYDGYISIPEEIGKKLDELRVYEK